MLEKLKNSLQYFNFALLVSVIFLFLGKDNKIEIGRFQFELKEVNTEQGTIDIKVTQELKGDTSQLDTIVEVKVPELIDTAKTDSVAKEN